MSNYNHAKDLEGQVLTLIEAIVPNSEQAVAAKSIFRRLFHEWSMGIDVGYSSNGSCDTESNQKQWEAKIEIVSPGNMSKEKRKLISEWLVQHSKDLLKEGHKYVDNDVFVGRYMK